MSGDNSVITVTWANMANGDDGAPFKAAEWGDRSVQAFGTWGAAGNMRVEGSNDQVNYSPLTDPQGNALDYAAAKIEVVTEVTKVVRPRVTAGDGTTDITVVLLARRSQPLRT